MLSNAALWVETLRTKDRNVNDNQKNKEVRK